MAYSSEPTTLLRGAQALPGMGDADRTEILPDLEPAPHPRPTSVLARSLKGRVNLTHASARNEETDPLMRPEVESLLARLTVYVLNAVVLFCVFPVGFALLIFNILGGENLRTTAHVVALTGLALALDVAGKSPTVFGI